MFSCKLSIFFNLPKNEKIPFSLGRPLKCSKEEKPVKIHGCWRDLYLNQFSLLWPFTGCSMLVLCCLLVSDDVKSKLLPLMHIHYELEDLVSWQLQISVTQKSKVFAGARVQWLPWLWLHNSFHSIPLLYNSVFSKLLTFGLIFPSSLSAAKSGFLFWKVGARAACQFWKMRVLLMKILGVFGF